MSKKRTLWSIVGVLVAVGVFYAGFTFGMYKGFTGVPLAIAQEGTSTKADFTAFWKVWAVLNKQSIYRDRVTPQQMVWGATEGLAASLGDPYTVFFPPKKAKAFESLIRGDFGGIGIKIAMQDGKITVIAPLPNTPAAEAGIKSGDEIVSINGSSTAQMTLDDVSAQIRGKVGSRVVLGILHQGEEKPVTVAVERATIDIPTIKTQALSNGIFDIALYSFTSQSPELFKKAFRQFKESGDHKLILDLRGNPGGYLGAAVDAASYFLPVGSVVVKEESGGKVDRVYRSKGYNVFGKDLKMVILVDGGTASAAEILSGALQQHGIATLVGTQTFGKGSVQELLPISNGTELKVTIAEWLTPNGTSISKNGLTPDVVVEVTKEDILVGKDPQLTKAIDILNGK